MNKTYTYTLKGKTMYVLIDGYKKVEVDIVDTTWGERALYNGRLYSFRKDGTLY